MKLETATGPSISPAIVKQHQTREMFYSVVWSTEDRNMNEVETVDLAENKELWLSKLGAWTEALDVFEQKLLRDPHDFDAILGCMRCLSSRGEWRRVLELVEDNWPIISGNMEYGMDQSEASALPQHVASKDQKKALRMCAEAAWRLGRWDDLDKYASELVPGQGATQLPVPTGTTANGLRDGIVPRVDFYGAFYSAVLHVHRKDWTMAAGAIDAARKAMDSRFTALMAESYNRAYPSMVTAQTLAEMEEIIDFQKLEKDAQGGAHHHPANRLDVTAARNRLLSVWRKRLAGCR